MRATTEIVEDNKVKLSVVVDEAEIDSALDSAVRSIGSSARIPGFRPGKVPRRVLEARMGGATALRAEALREALPDFYAKAVVDTEVDPIAPPEIDITEGEESGPVHFAAIVEVRPKVNVAGYDGLTTTIPSPLVNDADVAGQIDRLRENDGELIDVTRPILNGDLVTLDLKGNDEEGNEVAQADDYLYEVGSGVVIPELDEALLGLKAGADLEVSGTPAGGTLIVFSIVVTAVKEKKLPEVSDAWAEENSEFSTVAELEADLRERIGRMKVVQAQMSLRESTLGALAELVNEDEVPDVLIDAEVNERLHDLGHRLESQNMSIEQFLSATGQSGDQLVLSLRTDATKAVKVDLALRAVASAENLDVSPEELEEEIVRMAEQVGSTPDALRAQLDQAGRTGALKAEKAKSKAASWLVEHVTIVDEEGVSIDRALLETNVAELEAEDDSSSIEEEK
ncbi:MAG: trigger factor [Actinomycetes bacterium]|jgi:trigger factor